MCTSTGKVCRHKKYKAIPTAQAIGTALHFYPQAWVLTIYSQSGGA